MRLPFIILMLIATIDICLVCECTIKNDFETELRESDVVVIGKVAEILDVGEYEILGNTNKNWGHKVKVEILTTFKGVEKLQYIVIQSWAGTCSFSFRKGIDYLVYARTVDGNLNTSICTRTAETTNNPDIVQLKNKNFHHYKLSISSLFLPLFVLSPTNE